MHYRSLPLGILGLTLHRKRRTSVSRPPGYLTLITVVGSAVHLGSALNEEELGALKAAARQRLVDGQGEFDLGLGVAAAGSPLEITASRAAHLWDAGRHGTATAHRDMMRPQPGIGRAALTAANPSRSTLRCESTLVHNFALFPASKLRRQDSNLNSQNQNLMCCRLHHDGPRTSGE
jgi:hypothetical protein